MRIIKKSITIIARDNISDIINTTSVAPYTTDVSAVQPNGDFSSILPFVIISVALVLVILGTTAYISDTGYNDSEDDHINSIPNRFRDNIIGTEQDELTRSSSPIEFRRSIPDIDFETFV